MQVMVSTSGAQLLPPAAVATLIKRLLPLTTILTPNIPEAKLLLQRENEPDPGSKADMIRMAQDLCQLGPKHVLVKGGHLRPGSQTENEDIVVDVLSDGTATSLFVKLRIESTNTHGTGCSLACTTLPTDMDIIYVLNTASCYCLTNSSRRASFRRCSESMPLRRSGHQDRYTSGKRSWAYQPFSFHIHTSVCTVNLDALSSFY